MLKIVHMLKSLGCVLSLSFLGWTHIADAQSFAAPPIISSVDQNGVDLVGGTFTLPGLDVSIGGEGSGLDRATQGDFDSFSGGLNFDYMVVAPGPGKSVYFFRASYGGKTYSFVMGTPGDTAVQFATDWRPEMGGNAQLKCDAPLTSSMPKVPGQTCTMRLGDGTLVHYDVNMSTGIPWAAIDTVTKADGEVLSFNYHKQPGTVGYPYEQIKAVRTVTSSLGWTLKYSVDENYKITDVVAVNSSLAYCGLDSVTCGVAASPRATLTVSGASNTITRNGTLLLTYSKSGNTTTITSPSGLTKSVVTAQVMRRGAVVDEVQSVTMNGQTWNYNFTGTTEVVTAPDTTTTSLEVTSYDITATTDDAGRTKKYQYSGSSYGGKSYLLKAIDPDATYSGTTLTGGFIDYAYDTRGNVIKTTLVPKNGAPGGVTDLTKAIVTSATYSNSCDDTNFKYCNKPLTTTDANGVVTTYSYHAASGNVATMTLPPAVAGGATPQRRYSYVQVTPHVKDATGNLVASGPVWRLSEVSSCMTLSACSDVSTPVDQLKTSYTYETSHALPISKTTTHGNSLAASTASLTTAMTYDANGDVIVIDGPQAGAIDESYSFFDVMRRPVGTLSLDPDGTSALKRKASYRSYDADGRVASSEQGIAGTGLAAAYSGVTSMDRWAQASADWTGRTILRKDTIDYQSGTGLPIIYRHYEGATLTGLSQVSYDARGRQDCVARRQNPIVFSTVTSTGACSLGTQGADGPDRITKFGYDTASNVVSQTSAYGTLLAQSDYRKYFNISSGTISYIEDAKGNRTSYNYDNFNRLTKTCYPSKTTIHTSSTTDCKQVTYRTTTLAGVSQGTTLIGTVTLRDGQIDTFAYDDIGRIKEKAGTVLDTVSYDNFNQVKSRTQNGVTENYIYDTAGWMLSDAQEKGTVTRTYDSYGRRSSLTYPGGALYVTYSYDTGGSLSTIKENGTTILATYSYDDYARLSTIALGNGANTSVGYDTQARIDTLNNTLPGGGNQISFGYNPANQITSRTQSSASYEYRFPASSSSMMTSNGLNQMMASGTSTLTYDNRGNLVSDGAVTYTYNANNLLTALSTGYALSYDAENRLRSVDNGGGNGRYFLYDGNDLIAEYTSGGSVLRRYVHGPGQDNPVVWYEGATTANKYFLQADERGSIAAVSNASGSVQAIYSYDEYGVPATNYGTMSSAFRYTGQVWLPEIGLYYYKARVYASSLGRFLQTDPIGYGDGMNWYSYAHNDPLSFTDPSGTDVYYTGSGSNFSCTTYTTHYYYQYADGHITNAPGHPDYDTTYCDATGGGYDDHMARQSGFTMDNSGGRFGYTTYTKPTDINTQCIAATTAVDTDSVPDKDGGDNAIPQSRGAFAYRGGTVSGAVGGGGTYSRGSFSYIAKDSAKYSGHYVTKGLGVGWGAGADYSAGGSWSTSAFFGRSVAFAGSWGPVSTSEAFNGSGMTASIGLGIGEGIFAMDTTTYLDGPLKFEGCRKK